MAKRLQEKLRGVPEDGDNPRMMHIPASVRIGDDPLPVTISLPGRWLPPLSAKQRASISAEADVNFLSEQDWANLDDALNEFAWASRLAKNGVTYESIRARMVDYKKLAIALLEAMSIKDKTDELAYNRILKLSGDEVYPQVSRFVRASVQAIAAVERESMQASVVPPLTRFLTRVEAVFKSKGVRAGKSKPKDYSNPRPSQFQRFVRAMLRTLHEDAPPNLSDTYTAAFMQNVADAMAGSR